MRQRYMLWSVTVVACLFSNGILALDIITNGKAVSTIVIPDQASKVEQEGAQTLVKYLELATGVKLPIVAESAKPSGTLISFGKTSLAAKAGVDDRNLEGDGYRLKVGQGTLFLLGRDGKTILWRNIHPIGARGSIRAALGLLERVGFRWLQPVPRGVYVPEMKTVSVADNLDVTYEPVFLYECGDFYYVGRGNDEWRMANSFRQAVLLCSQGGGHTWSIAVPASLWDTHPEYFVMHNGRRIKPNGIQNQLCPSNPDVVRMIGKYLIDQFEQGFESVNMGQSDGWTPCECDACKAIGWGTNDFEQCHYAQYNAIKMAGEKYPDRKVNLLIYGPMKNPSARFKQYPTNTMTEVSIYNDNAKAAKILAEVQARIPGGSSVYCVDMCLQQNVGMAPKFTPRQAAEKILMLREHNVKGFFFDGGGENWGAEGPTYYVLGRMMTDPDANWQDLVKEYCRITFGKADDTMVQYYNLLYDRIEKYYYKEIYAATCPDAFTAVYTPEVLDRLQNLLTLAKDQARGDERALGWVRVAQISHDQFALIAKTFHLYQAYVIAPSMESLKQVAKLVGSYKSFVDGMSALQKTDPAFVTNYFPLGSFWLDEKASSYGSLRNNFFKLTSPFTWDFDALVKANFLPGKSRARMVAIRLNTSPTINGDTSEPAWKNVPWVEVGEVSLGKAEASTRLRLGYDDTNLYFAFECSEPLIDEMKIMEYSRDDEAICCTECVEIFLAPDGVGQKCVQFIVNPNKNGKWDGRYGYIDDPYHPLNLNHLPDMSWDPKYVHAYKIDPANKKWSVEIAFPFAEMGVTAPAKGTLWRANFGRERHKQVWDKQKYKGQSEYFLWSPNLQQVSFTDPCAFGDLYFGNFPENMQ